MSLSEIPESEAAGRIAEIYRAILDATGLPSTNLVWRHMASRPGVLEWAYDGLQEAFPAGAFRVLAAEIVACVPPPAMPGLDPGEGLDPATLESAGSVMAFYNRANPINLVALAALRRLLAGADLHRAAVLLVLRRSLRRRGAGRDGLRRLPAAPAALRPRAFRAAL